MKTIKLSKGAKFVIVDDEDYESLIDYKWCLNNKGYAVRAKRLPERGIILMHRVIMNAQSGQMLDHRNRNRLDNRKINLRFCNKSQNSANAKLNIKNSSGFKGVCRHTSGKWVAYVSRNSQQIYIGLFNSADQAAKAYNNSAKKLYGDFALLNKI